MSAERYEIFDDGPCIRIVSPDSTISTIVGRPVGYHIDDAVIGAIRQQARDLDQLRTDLAAAVAEMDKLRAFKSAVEAAPVVACVSYVDAWKVFVRIPNAPMPPIGTELIARPAKD